MSAERTALLRIDRELREARAMALKELSVEPISGQPLQWHAEIVGPKKSAYEGGKFKLHICFPENYPFKPPLIVFRTPMYHPNIDEYGTICLDAIKSTWTPMLTVVKVLQTLIALLNEPNPDSPLRHDIATQYSTDRKAFDKAVRDHIKQNKDALLDSVHPIRGRELEEVYAMFRDVIRQRNTD